MKTGNKSQAMILAVVAVLAIGFLIYQLLPGKEKPSFVARAPEVSLSPSAGAVATLSLEVAGNPFSHPKLAPSEPAAVPKAQPPSQIDKSGSVTPVSPEMPQVAGQTPGTNAAENAGKTRLKIQGPSIKLTAIMRVGDPVAMLNVNDKSGQTFGVGDLIDPKTRLIAIGGSSITVEFLGEEHEIATGETCKLSKDETK